jgi:hypothetical protein
MATNADAHSTTVTAMAAVAARLLTGDGGE